MLLSLALSAFAVPQDLVLKNARVFPGDGASWRGDLVVIDGRIAEAGAKPKPNALTKDLAGAWVMPGLQDAHGHLLGLGAALEEVDLFGAKSYAEIVERVQRVAAQRKPGEWILGRGWDQNLWPDTAMPHHRDLSAATPDHPVWLVRVDGHAALANARAMRAARLDKATPAPSGGEILRDEAGEATGVLVDRAMGLVPLPEPSLDDVRRRLLAAQQQCAVAGLTCVHDAGVSGAHADLLRAMADEGSWTLRVHVMLSGDQTSAIEKGPQHSKNQLVQVRAVKAYADGALGSRGALLLEPYSDKAGWRGLPLSAGLLELAQRCADAGMQLCVHAIGDAANRKVLDVFEATRFADGEREKSRWRIEHCQVVHETDRRRFVDLAVIPSMQPTHLTSDMPWAVTRLGEARIGTAYAWRQLLDLSLPVAFGSDFPVESVDPRKGLFSAVTTSGSVDGEPMRKDQQLSRVEALRGFTLHAARAMFAEQELGAIAPGKIADLTVFDRDLTQCAEDEILAARVLLTVVGGRVTFAADD